MYLISSTCLFKLSSSSCMSLIRFHLLTNWYISFGFSDFLALMGLWLCIISCHLDVDAQIQCMPFYLTTFLFALCHSPLFLFLSSGYEAQAGPIFVFFLLRHECSGLCHPFWPIFFPHQEQTDFIDLFLKKQFLHCWFFSIDFLFSASLISAAIFLVSLEFQLPTFSVCRRWKLQSIFFVGLVGIFRLTMSADFSVCLLFLFEIAGYLIPPAIAVCLTEFCRL